MSVNLEGLVPVRTIRYGGEVDWDDPIQIPNGLAIVCQNMQFLAESVKVRWGMRQAMALLGVMADATGLDVLTVLGSPQAPTVTQQAGGGTVSPNSLNPNVIVGNNALSFEPITPGVQVSLVFGDNGVLYWELPAGSGNLVALPPTSNIATFLAAILPSATAMQTAKAYNRIYQAYAHFMNLVSPTSAAPVLALDAGTGFVSPVGQNPVAAAWQPKTFYQQGDIVTPTANPNTWFRRLVDGYSGEVEPTWPTALGYFTPTYVPSYAEALDGAVSNALQAPVTALGTQTVKIGLPIGMYTGLLLTVDTGGSAETVTVIRAFYNSVLHAYYLTAVFTKTHLTGAPLTANSYEAWQEWTPGYPAYLPTPNPITSVTSVANAGAIPAGVDVYICLSYFNDLGESVWTAPVMFYNTLALAELTGTFGTANPASGPPMPSWLMSVMNTGTTSAGYHWPALNAIQIYVNSVAHGSPAPTQFKRYGQIAADRTVVVGSIPGGGTLYNPTTQPTAAISTEPFAGEGGQRFAILLRQNTMGDLSPVDPRAAIGVTFQGATTDPGIGWFNNSNEFFVAVDDISNYAAGLTVNLNFPGATGAYKITGIYLGQTLALASSNVAPEPQAAPSGILLFAISGTFTGGSVAGFVSLTAGPCPVAVVPPGTTEGPGYCYDILAFTVVGLGADGPFNYLASPTPDSPFSTSIIAQQSDGLGDGYAQVASVSGLAPGNNILIAGWTSFNTGLNGLRTLASVNAAVDVVTFPDSNSSALIGQAAGVTMTLVQTQPTQVVAGTIGILLQFDDTTLPEGVDVTGNLLFVALPPCTDLAYLPSVSRMAYVSDLFPTTLIFSEEDFMGEVDGENDILAIDASNGATLSGARELLNGTIVAAKQNGGYQVIPTDDVPARWGLGTLWGNHGPWSGKNIAKGRDGGRLPFFLFVDPESGVYKWPPTLGMGELDDLSKELSGANNQDASRMATWDRVNRAAGATIEVVVDTIAKEVKIAVPLDGATSPSHILTMSYFNGWQDPLLLTLSGEWVPSRQARRWNIDPIPTNCMALVKRTLGTPVDQRVNYQQLLLGVPTVLAASYANIIPTSLSQGTNPTLAPGTYFAQLAKVTGGNETAYTPVLGPFTVSVTGAGPYAVNTFQAVLPADGLEDSWTIYFGTSPTTLTKKITGIRSGVPTYNVTTAGVAATQPTGFIGLDYMQPGAYDDLGGGYLARYRPGYAKEAPSQAWPDGGRVCRFSAITGSVLGEGNMLITPVTDDPTYQPKPITVNLEAGTAEVPGSAPITRLKEGMKGDNEFLTCEFSNGGVPDNWFQLLFHTLWHKPLMPTK